MEVEVRSLEKYLSTSNKKILKEVNRSRKIENNKYGRSKEEIHKKHREKYEGQPLHGQFRKITEGVRGKRSWDWLKKVYLKKETLAHVVSECSKLAQKEYKQVRYDNVAKMLHWKLFEKWGFNKAEKWYTHNFTI